MAQFHGSEGVVKIGANTVAEVVSFSVEQSAETYQTTEPTMNAPQPALTYSTGATSWTASIECKWDDTDTNGQEALTIGAEDVAVELYPEGTTVGYYKLSGNVAITGVSTSVSFDGIVTRSFTAQGDGALTIGVAS